VLNQITSQTRKLIETRDVFRLNEDRSLLRELLLVKVPANEAKRSAIREIADVYGAEIVDLSVDSMIVELTGAPKKIDAFLEVIGEYDIVEMCRTGITALERGINKR
jgi:acetolactate synthase-1/3 small subunit